MNKWVIGFCGGISALYGDAYEHRITHHLDEGKIQIEDGSIWEVVQYDREKTEKFLDVPLSFRADESWLSAEAQCCFINKISNEKIVVALVSPPDSYIQFSHWVAYLEPKKSILFLDNGSIFSLYDNDREYFKNWLVDDFVITGDYQSWMSQNKHILFNYRTKKFIFGDLH
jgi:hypothetical protein